MFLLNKKNIRCVVFLGLLNISAVFSMQVSTQRLSQDILNHENALLLTIQPRHNKSNWVTDCLRFSPKIFYNGPVVMCYDHNDKNCFFVGKGAKQLAKARFSKMLTYISPEENMDWPDWVPFKRNKVADKWLIYYGHKDKEYIVFQHHTGIILGGIDRRSFSQWHHDGKHEDLILAQFKRTVPCIDTDSGALIKIDAHMYDYIQMDGSAYCTSYWKIKLGRFFGQYRLKPCNKIYENICQDCPAFSTICCNWNSRDLLECTLNNNDSFYVDAATFNACILNKGELCLKVVILGEGGSDRNDAHVVAVVDAQDFKEWLLSDKDADFVLEKHAIAEFIKAKNLPDGLCQSELEVVEVGELVNEESDESSMFKEALGKLISDNKSVAVGGIVVCACVLKAVYTILATR